MLIVRTTHIGPGKWALAPNYYCEEFRDLARNYPGLVWNKLRKAWIGPSDSAQLLAEAVQQSDWAELQGVEPKSIVASLSVPSTDHEKQLRNYQRTGLAFLLAHAHEGVLLGDATGTGKSRQSLLAALRLGMPTVIVAPASIKHVWRREGEKLGLDIAILQGSKPPENARITPEDGIVVINYDVLHAWVEMLKGARTVIFDEAHALINEKSKRSQAAREIAKAAKYRIAVTATPVSTRPRDLWNMVDTISPGRFGKFFGYGLRYCNGHQKEITLRNAESKKVWDFDGASHLDELNLRLKHFMIRRSKEEVNLELPPKTRQVIELDVPVSAIDTSWSWDRAGSLRTAFERAAIGKIPYTVELATNAIKEGNNAVIFAYERRAARAIEDACKKAGFDVFIATGEHTVEKRMLAVEQAKKAGPSILVATIRAMGEGIDLSYASVGIVYELDYVPRALIQLEGRFHRPGQTRNVTIYYLVANDTIDEKIRDKVLSRLDVFERMLGDTGADSLGSDLKGHTEEEILAELRDMLLAGP